VKDYQHFSAEEFTLDEYFREWLLQPTAEADEYWSTFLLQHPEKYQAVEQAKVMLRALQNSRPIDHPYQLESEWLLLNQHIGAYEQSQRQRHLQLVQRYSLAACIMLCMIGGFWWLYAQGKTTTYTTAFNETREVVLPDGSTVILNANSTLSFASDWDSALVERIVMLEGEAFFAVEEKEVRQGDTTFFAKFIVKTDQIEVEVLGTRFNVNNHSSEPQVALESGKVLVRNSSGEALYLVPGEIAALSENRLYKKNVETELITSWKENKLLFEETPVPEILEMIENRYGYKIIVKTDKLNDKVYTGSSPANDIDLLTYKLSRLYSLDIHKEGNNLTITDKF
jgi:ferric-dicitrate binding protein FerR (iron transport regulator)